MTHRYAKYHGQRLEGSKARGEATGQTEPSPLQGN